MTEAGAILLISPERWDQHFVSKHHYAITLVRRGARVLFLNPPDNSLPEIRLTKIGEYPGLTLVDGPAVAPGLRFWPRALRRKVERGWLDKLEARVGAAICVIWLFENSRFFDLGFAGSRLKIYHQVDLNQAFNLEKAAASADICFCTTDLIKAQISVHNPRVFKIHHGLAEVSAPLGLDSEHAARFSKLHFNAVYVGNLDMQYLDLDLLEAAVDGFPDVTFHLVGGYASDGATWCRLSSKPNIEWWGKVDYRMIPSILDFADLLLVTYQREHFKDQASPHKLMEYLASGKMIVATYTDEYKDKRDLLAMAEPDGEYLELLRDVIGNLGGCNALENAEKRKRFALEHSYPRQLGRIEQVLHSHGFSLLSDSG